MRRVLFFCFCFFLFLFLFWGDGEEEEEKRKGNILNSSIRSRFRFVCTGLRT